MLRILKRHAHHFKVAHPRRGQLIAGAVDALGILSGGELDGARGIGKEHRIPVQSELVLDHHGLAADHVGRPVQKEFGCHPSGQRAIEVRTAIVERVDHVHRRRNRAGGLVDVAVQRRVRVRIDDAGRQPHAGRVNHRCGRGRVHAAAHSGDLARMHPHRAVFDGAVTGGHDSCIFDHQISSARGRLLCAGHCGQDDDSKKGKANRASPG
jgi:hypothetical protein